MGFKEVIYSLIFLPTNNELKMHKSTKSLHIQSIKVAIVAMNVDNSSMVSIVVLFFIFSSLIFNVNSTRVHCSSLTIQKIYKINIKYKL